MEMLKRMAALLLAATMAAASPVSAQDTGDDWDFGADPARKLTIAAVSFDNFGIAVRCMDGTLGVVMSGLPEASGERRLAYSMGDRVEPQSLWVSGRRSTSAFTLWPRFVAEGLSRGGRLTVAALDGETVRRYAVDVPPSTSAIKRVFEACGRTFNAAVTGGGAPSGESLGGLRWVSQPRPSFPTLSGAESGVAAITCTLRANGRFEACEIESEFPEGAGFGRAATLAAHRQARAEGTDPGVQVEGRRVTFVNRFNMSQSQPLPPMATRLPPREMSGSD